MDPIDWSVAGAAVVAVLALVANVFSAIGATHSADKAGQAEARIAAGERAAAFRELSRTQAMIQVESRIADDIIEDAGFALRAYKVATGGHGQSPQASRLSDLSKRRSFVAGLAAHLNESPNLAGMSADAIGERQILLDEVLIKLRAEKEIATRELHELLRDRDLEVMRPQPGWQA